MLLTSAYPSPGSLNLMRRLFSNVSPMHALLSSGNIICRWSLYISIYVCIGLYRYNVLLYIYNRRHVSAQGVLGQCLVYVYIILYSYRKCLGAGSYSRCIGKCKLVGCQTSQLKRKVSYSLKIVFQLCG